MGLAHQSLMPVPNQMQNPFGASNTEGDLSLKELGGDNGSSVIVQIKGENQQSNESNSNNQTKICKI